MSLTPDQVQRIARLARIALGAGESAPVMARLNRVLGLIEQMRAVDTRAVEPMAHPLDTRREAAQRLRPDAVTEADRRAEYQEVAPQVEGGLYLVPKVLD